MREHTKNIIGLIIGVFTSVFLLGWSYMQLDGLLAGWRGEHWEDPFTFFWGIHSKIGLAYDLLLVIIALAFIISFVAVFAALWLWDD